MIQLNSESVPRVLLKFDCMARWIYPHVVQSFERLAHFIQQYKAGHVVRARLTVLLPVMFRPLVIITSILSLGRMMASAAFSSKCNDFSMCGSVLRASCKDDAGVVHATTVDLDTCFGFLFRIGLVCDPQTYLPYSHDCGQCAISGTDMWCVCPEERGLGPELIWMRSDLDQCIQVNNGTLSCVDKEV